jgi:hypothetical protein
MWSVKITVTQKHIDEGRACDSHYCAIALALKDAGYGYVTVGASCVNLFDRSLKMAPETRQWRHEFDVAKLHGYTPPPAGELEFYD